MQVLTSTKARSFAETRWGRGGTHAYRTNRKGVYYFACSGHGGYIVDGNALTPDERQKIDEFVTPESCVMVRLKTNGKVTFLSNPYTIRTQKYRFNPDYHELDMDYPIYFFEEDCDWAVLEKFTDIRAKNDSVTPERREEIINETFARWFDNS